MDPVGLKDREAALPPAPERIRQRRLGRTALELPPVVLGGMFRDPLGRRRELERAIDVALELGLCAIDTAPLYGFGAAEALLGELLAERRSGVVLMTKVGLRWDAAAAGEPLFEAEIAGRRRAVRRDSRPQAVRRDVEESLSRLRCETLDLVQIHHRDRGTPLEETLGELLRLRSEGKLREIGVSNFEADEIVEAQRALADQPLASVQSAYSLLERRVEREILPCVRAQGIGFLAYSPLARGLLGGRMLPGTPPLRDGRAQDALFQPANLQLIHAALREGLDPLARAHDTTPGAVALAWLLASPGVSGVLAGAQSEAQVREAAAAASLELDASTQVALGRAFERLPLDHGLGRVRADRWRRRLRRWWHRLSG